MMNTIFKIANFVILLGIGMLAYHIHYESIDGLEVDEFVRGDFNDDYVVNIADASHILGFLFLGTGDPPCPSAADADDDGKIRINDASYVLNFLFLGGPDPSSPFPQIGLDPTPNPELGCRGDGLPPLPAVNSLGGPDRELNEEEELSWLRGRELFDQPATIAKGLGPIFNGDSCRGCHLDPVIGGSGGLDVNVIRFARKDIVDKEEVIFQIEGGPAASRFAIATFDRDEMNSEANVVETRQTPTVLGLGLVDRIPEANLLANADPDDMDKNGISGRARMVDGRPGRFGHKCGVPSLLDFTADASFNELGFSVNPALTPFAGGSDSDAAPDPELTDQEFLDLVFFVSHIAPPLRNIPTDPTDLQDVQDGEQFFNTIGCTNCHIPTLQGNDGPVNAYSDFLLHDVATPDRDNVNEPGVEPSEFRTAPLWGLRDTAPYLHDGSAETLREAIEMGHFGEATETRLNFEALSFLEKLKLEDFLLSL